MSTFTPMMQQYFGIKEQHKDAILFFRLGDFYEMFFEDAELASKELEIALTGRDCGQEERAPMCGVPYHSCDGYIARLVQRGYKVAICEQTETPAEAKGIVKREVVRVITPGTVIENSMLDEEKNNYFCLIYTSNDEKNVGLCFADCSTGEIHVLQIEGEDVFGRVMNEVGRFSPREVLVNSETLSVKPLCDFLEKRMHLPVGLADPSGFGYDEAEKRIVSHFGKSLEELRLAEKFSAIRALSGSLLYLSMTQMIGLERVKNLNVFSDVQFMNLDITARRNLELTETIRSGDKRGTLLWVLDHSKTAMGKRMMRSWLEQPLIHLPSITRRHSAVDELFNNIMLRGDIRDELGKISDIERILTRIVYGNANGRDVRLLSQTLCAVAPIKEKLVSAKSELLKDTEKNIDSLHDVISLIENAIVDDPPFSVREGGIIKTGFNAEIDELHFEMSDGKNIIARVEAEEKEKTGIRTLKVGYNRIFGYYIEVTKSNIGQVPEHYVRKQTLANAERYITEELKELEARVISAKDRVVVLEYEVFNTVRLKIAEQLDRIQQTAHAVAHVDVLCSFAKTAQDRGYSRPVMSLDGEISIKDGRHAVVEAIVDLPFVPNDTNLDENDRIALITGPNMAGKSTYMRQTALIVLLAQIGCFVPAKSATIGIVDSIFTRVGASDDLSSGQSTFMVEMNEVAAILKTATASSLIIFDEIGRGTSTFDGMSIARAVLEYVANKVKAKTMFATHYHELTVIEHELSCIKNYNIAVKKRGDDITFLRRIVKGPADESYGIEVAKLAGVPNEVVSRAKEILLSLEDGNETKPKNTISSEDRFLHDDGQISLLPDADNELVSELKNLDINTLTPIEALQKLYELNKLANKF